MTASNDTIRLTTAQAIIRWLSNQFIEIDGREMRVCGGGFGIFGHGNVTCLGEALNRVHDQLPLYRGQNEQGMGFAAAGYAKQWLRQRFMFCTASAGPGTANLLTAAGLAHANRLPILMLCGDTFITRLAQSGCRLSLLLSIITVDGSILSDIREPYLTSLFSFRTKTFHFWLRYTASRNQTQKGFP